MFQILKKTILIFLIPMHAASGWLLVTAVNGAQFGIESPAAIIDQGGRRIKIEQRFNRIISLYGAHTENLFELGLDDEIIGVSRHEVYPPQALRKPAFSYHDDPEKFLAAFPDLVLIRPMIDNGYPQFVSRLEKSGITVVSLQPGTIDEIYVYWEILGILTGKRQHASELKRRFQTAVSELKNLTANIPQKKKVYFEAIHDKMKTFSPDCTAVFALEAAGGINVAHDAEPHRNTNIANYGKERILSHAGEIDVYLAQFGTMNRPTVSLIKNEPGFQVIKAVQDNQVHIVEESIVSRPTFRLLDGIYAIGKILYPDVFGEDAVRILERAK